MKGTLLRLLALLVLLPLVIGIPVWAQTPTESWTNFILGAPVGSPTSVDVIACIEGRVTHNCSLASLLALGSGGGSLTTSSQVIAALGYTPVNRAGDSMTGTLTLATSTASAAGLVLPPGAAPTSPPNGACWISSTQGLFCEINGAPVGPYSTAGVSTLTGDCTGTASGGTVTTTCAPLSHLAAAETSTGFKVFSGGVATSYVTFSNTTTLATGIGAACGDLTGGSFTITLPPGTGGAIPNGYTIPIKDCKRLATATTTLTVGANSGQTIEGAAAKSITIGGGDLVPKWNATTNNWDLF